MTASHRPPPGTPRRRRAAAAALAAAVAAAAALAPARGPLAAQEARPAAAAPARAPITPAAIDARLQQGIPDADVRADVVAVIAAAGERGLPMQPLVTKALEGIEKGAPPTRIAAAVRAMASRLATASAALAPVVAESDLRAGADALGAGVPAEVLRRVREASSSRPSAVALGVVAQLTARGVPAAKAGAAVAVLLRGGASAPQLMALERLVKEDLAVGVPPSAALDLRMRALTSALPPTLPAAATAADELQTFGAPRSTPKPRPRP